MSPGAPLNSTADAQFASGTSPPPAPTPPPPPTPPVPPAAGKRPHIVVFLADDLGYGNVGYTRAAAGAAAAEVRTPTIDALVAAGIELSRNYVYRVCSPTRSSFQSGRLPVHVNTANLDPAVSNPADPVSGFAGIPRNMTGIATKLRAAGYKTHFVGKWDAGMATPDHTPAGRGYDTSFGYFHHDNDYWTERLWATYNDTGYSPQCRAVIVDLWRANATHGSGSGGHGARGENGTAPTSSDWAWLPPGCNGTLEAFEETKFANEALAVIAAHPGSSPGNNNNPATPQPPLFLSYNFHVAHEPIELPRVHFEAQRRRTAASGVGDFDNRRTTYQGMVNFMDGVIGNVTAALKARGMWEDTLYVFSSDNGGPSFAGSHHLAANNFPLRGSKASDWEGGVRAVGWVGGGFVGSRIPHMAGAKLTGPVHVCE